MSGMELIMMAASMAVSAGGQAAQGRMTQQQYNRAALEAGIAGERAAHAAASDAAGYAEDAERTIGSALTIAGASGFDTSGSAVDILADLASQRRFNTNAIIYGGDIERRQLLSSAANYRFAGNAARQQGNIAAFSTVMQGGYRMMSLDRGP